VQQIKDATGTQPGTWALILGSSVIAAMIGAGASIYTSHVSGRDNRDLEVTKAQIQRDSDTVKKRNEAYERLGRDLGSLAEGLGGTRILLVSLGPSRSDPVISQRVTADLQSVGQAALMVRESEGSPLISREIADQIDRILGMFLPALGAAQSDKAKVNAFLQVIDPTEVQIKATKLSLNRINEALSGAAADVGKHGSP